MFIHKSDFVLVLVLVYRVVEGVRKREERQWSRVQNDLDPN